MFEDMTAALVGRQAQVDLLDQALDRVRNGQFAVVEISGEPGIGKTRILAELAQRARAAGLVIYAGSATPIERTVPFGVYVDALRPIAPPSGDLPDDRAAAALRTLREQAPAPSPGTPADLFHLHTGLQQLLSDKVAFCLDDLHWADPASLALTEYLIRKPPQGPALIALVFNSTWSHSGIIDAVGRLGAAAFRVAVPPLASADLDALLPAEPQHRRTLILRAGRGNPRHTQALARLNDAALAALAADIGVPEHHLADSPPRHLLANLATEITTLAPEAQCVAHAAAVVGDPATIDLVAHVAQRPVPVVADVVDQMHQLGLIRVDGAWLRFRHQLLRLTAYWLAGPAWRLEAHARAAGYLRQHGGALHVRADHTERSAREGDEPAVRLLVEAARAYAYRAPAKVARWLGTALRILPGTGPWPARRPSLVLRYVHALTLSGQLPAGRNVQELLHPDRPMPTQAVTLRAMLARLHGNLDAAAALLGTPVVNRARQPLADAARRIELAAVAVLDAEPADALDHAEQALHLLGPDRPELIAAAQALRAWGALDCGHTAQAGEHVERAAAMADAAPDTALRPRIEVLCALAWIELRLGQLDAAARHLARARSLVAHLDQSGAQPYLLIVEGALRCRRGQLARSVELLDDAATLARRVGNLELVSMADTVRLRPLLWMTGPAAAIAVGRQLTEANRPHSGFTRRAVKLELAVAHAVADDGMSLDLLSAAPQPNPTDPLDLVTLSAAQAMLTARSGDVATARQHADRAAAAAAEAGLSYEQGLAAYAKGYVAARANSLADAVAAAREALSRFIAAGAAVEVARAHHLLGQLHRRAGHHEQSRDEFARAESGYLDSGADWLLTTLRDEETPATVKPGQMAVAERLTAREQEIAHLVTTGLSNQEIASRLFLSRRTVESHVSRIFTKLDVRSRVHLANRLNRLAAVCPHDGSAQLVTLGVGAAGRLPAP